MKRVSDAGRSLPPRAHPSPCVARSVAGLSAHLASRLQTLFLGHAVDSALQTILSAPLGRVSREGGGDRRSPERPHRANFASDYGPRSRRRCRRFDSEPARAAKHELWQGG